MIKKKSNAQNIIIIILSILLLISISFGVTYSYYNGKSNLVKGTISTASLSIGLQGVKGGQTSEFFITTTYDEELLVPGNKLDNVALNLINKCNQTAYMVVVYSLSAVKIDTKEDITAQLANTPAIDFLAGAYDTEIWQSYTYSCKNKDAKYTCLVGINYFEEVDSSNKSGVSIPVLAAQSIRIPTVWDDTLQNCNVTISITAYAVQADNIILDYPGVESTNMETRLQSIAEATLTICKVDVAPTNN